MRNGQQRLSATMEILKPVTDPSLLRLNLENTSAHVVPPGRVEFEIHVKKPLWGKDVRRVRIPVREPINPGEKIPVDIAAKRGLAKLRLIRYMKESGNSISLPHVTAERNSRAKSWDIQAVP